jgi:predicted amidohydrolase YtcJ
VINFASQTYPNPQDDPQAAGTKSVITRAFLLIMRFWLSMGESLFYYKEALMIRSVSLHPFWMVGIVLAFGVLTSCGKSQTAGRVFLNGHVITMTDSLPEAEAFAVDSGRIAAVGTSEEIRAAYPGAPATDLEGKTVMPGIVESHVHLFSLGQSFLELNLEGIQSPDEVVEKVRERATRTPAGEWITGWGWDEGAWARNYPSNEALSQASPRNPVWLRGLHGFAGWANDQALAIAGITRDTPNPQNGEILKNAATGKPTGILRNEAQGLVTVHIPPPSPAMMEQAMTLAGEECLRYGLTTVHDANVNTAMLDALHSLASRQMLKNRVYVMLDVTDKDLIESYLQRGPEVDPERRLTVRCIKIFADGALGSRGAALFEPYSDAPDARGQMTTSKADIEEITERALRSGFQVAVHAIGDRANRLTLDAYEAALSQVPEARDPRLRIEHAQVVSQEDIPRFSKLGIIASMQPPHCTSDMPWAETRVGPERIKGAYAWRSFLNAGVRVPLNSDFPGETPNPFWGMYAAETRKSPEGEPEGGWYPGQCLTRREVLQAYTIESAFAGFTENDLGRIAPGMLADFIVISDNILALPPASLLTLKVEQTYVGGQRVFSIRP